MKKSSYDECYREIDLIGRGSFGTANLVECKEDKAIYVAKKVLLGSLSKKEIESSELEVKLLRELRHPHIVEYKECFVEEGLLITIMEYCQEGDLKNLITKQAEKKKFLEEKIVLNWLLQILSALEFIHQKRILHRDIKSSNIFLKSDGSVKIGDFGIAKSLENTNEKAVTVIGTPYYMSPEVCENKPYTYKSDVWALGCVLYEMCALRNAFTAKNLLGLIYKIVRDEFDPLPEEISAEMAELIKLLLTKDESKRPSISEIIQTAFLQKTILRNTTNRGDLLNISKIPLKSWNHEVEDPIQTSQQQNYKNQNQENIEQNHKIKIIANESLKVMDLLEESINLEKKKARFPKKSNFENLHLKFSESRNKPKEKLIQPPSYHEVKIEKLDIGNIEDHDNDLISVEVLPETEIPLQKNIRSNYQINTFFTKESEFGIKNGNSASPQSSQSCYNQEQYEKRLRNVQRMIPRRPHHSAQIVQKKVASNEVSPKQIKTPENDVIQKETEINRNREIQQEIERKNFDEMEKELFDITQESVALSLAKTISDSKNDEQEDLAGTYLSEMIKSQMNLVENIRDLQQEEFTTKKNVEEIQEKILENLSLSCTLNSTIQPQNTIKSSTIKAYSKKKIQNDSDLYEDDYEEYEEEYEEDFEDYTSEVEN